MRRVWAISLYEVDWFVYEHTLGQMEWGTVHNDLKLQSGIDGEIPLISGYQREQQTQEVARILHEMK